LRYREKADEDKRLTYIYSGSALFFGLITPLFVNV
jgi:hypothetical protein